MKSTKRFRWSGPGILVLTVLIGFWTLAIPYAEANNDPLFDGTSGGPDQLIGASVLLGAGSALLVTSFLIQPEKEVVTGYTRDQFPEPIYTTIGTDTGNLIAVGTALVVLGSMFFVIKSGDQGDHSSASETAMKHDEGVGFGTTVVGGRAAGAGISFAF